MAQAQRLRTAFPASSPLRRACVVLLAECFDRLARPDAKLELLRVALQEDPGWVPGLLGEAEALAQLERLDDAIAIYERLLGVPGVPQMLATLHLRKQSQQLVERRNWARIEALLELDPEHREETLSHAPESHNTGVLIAETLRMQAAARWERGVAAGDESEKATARSLLDDAQQMLTASRDSHPDEAQTWGVLATFVGSRFDEEPGARLAAAQAILGEAELRLPNSAELRTAAIVVALAQSADVAADLIGQLDSNIESFPVEDRFGLHQALARGYASVGAWAQAIAAWESASLLEPADYRPHLAVLLLLLESAAEEPEQGVDDAAWNEHLTRLMQIEGGNESASPSGEDESAIGPSSAVCLARRLLFDAQRDPSLLDDAAQLAEMRRVLQAADRQRPHWPQIPRLRGQIEALYGQHDFAVVYFEEAFRRGDRSATVIGPLVAQYQSQVSSTHRLTREEAVAKLATLMAAVDQDNPALLYGNVGRIAQKALFDQGEHERAIGLAEQLYESTQEPQDMLMLAFTRSETLLRDEQDPDKRAAGLAEVEQQFRQITQEHPEWPEGWLSLVQFLTIIDRNADAVDAVAAAAEALPEEPAALKPLTLARCHQTLTLARGVPEEQRRAYLELATSEYEQALDAAPDDPGLLYAAAVFYLGSQRPLEAIEIADRLMSQTPPLSDAEQTRALAVKALALATTGVPANLNDAVDLLRQAKPEDELWQVHAWRALAVLLDQRNHPGDADEVISVLEQIVGSGHATFRERFTLAGLHEGIQGNWAQARTEYEELLGDLPDSRLLLAVLIDGIVRHEPTDRELTEANHYLDDLRIVEPDSYRTVVLESKLMAAGGDEAGAAEHLVAFVHGRLDELPAEDLLEQLNDNQVMEVMANLTQVAEQQQDEATLAILDRVRGRLAEGRREEATAELRGLAQAQWLVGEVRTEMLRSTATILEEFEQLAVAESLYREYAQKSRRSDAPLVLARYFGRQERYDEAIDICILHWDDVAAEIVASTSVGLLRLGRLPAARIAEVTSRIETSISSTEEAARRVELLRLLADIYDLQQRYDDAREVYLQILMLDQNHIIALNNLAWIFACRGDPVSGLEFINRAIEVAGPYAELLDTQGVALMHAGQSPAAVQVLEKAVEQSRSASILLHLADARLSAGDLAGAEAAFEEFRQVGGESEPLHPLDQPAHQRLQSAFASR